MRAILGGLLVAALFAWPSAATSEERSLDGPFHAEVVADALVYSGSSTLAATGGALLGHGPFEGSLHAPVLRLDSFRDEQTTVHVGPFQVTDHKYSEPSSQVLTNATVTFRGDADGILYVVLDHGELHAELPPLDGQDVFASATSWAFENAAVHHGQARDGPLVGFKHDPSRRLPAGTQGGGGLVPTSIHDVDLSFPEVPLERLQVQAPAPFSLDNATLVIDHDAGHLELRAQRRGRDVVAVDRSEVSEFLLLPSGGTIDLVVGDAGVAFVSPRPVLTVDGRASLPHARGRLALDGARELRDDALELEGQLSFVLAPANSAALGGAPELSASASGDATRARVGGVELSRRVPFEPPVPRPLVEALVAGVLLAWWALSRGAVGLFIRDPFANPRRTAIVDALRRAGFRHLRGLARDTSLPLGSLAYHLAILRRSGAVRAIRCDNRDVYFLSQSDLTAGEAALLCVLAAETTARVAEALVHAGAATQDELALRLGLDRSTISRHVAKLVKVGLAQPGGDGVARYQPRPLLRRWARSRA